MDIRELLSRITPEIYVSLKKSIEIGRWPDGRKLTSEQRLLSMQAVLNIFLMVKWEVKNLLL